MELPTWMRVVMLMAAGMNLLGAITFLPPGASLRAMGGLPSDGHQFYLATIAAFIFIFGIAYLWSARTGRADRLFITVAAAGKLSFSGLLVWFWADGSLPPKVLTSGVGDLVFGTLFAAWLLGTHRESAVRRRRQPPLAAGSATSESARKPTLYAPSAMDSAMTEIERPSVLMKGLFETHLNIADLERSVQFYEKVLGLQLGTRDDTRRLAIYWIGGWGQAFLGLWEKPQDQILMQHFAFEVDLARLEDAILALTHQRIEVRNFFEERTDVPSVFGWIPAASVYFSDPDGHLLECLAKLPGPPRPEIGIVSLPEWNRLNGVQG